MWCKRTHCHLNSIEEELLIKVYISLKNGWRIQEGHTVKHSDITSLPNPCFHASNFFHAGHVLTCNFPLKKNSIFLSRTLDNTEILFEEFRMGFIAVKSNQIDCLIMGRPWEWLRLRLILDNKFIFEGFKINSRVINIVL